MYAPDTYYIGISLVLNEVFKFEDPYLRLNDIYPGDLISKIFISVGEDTSQHEVAVAEIL